MTAGDIAVFERRSTGAKAAAIFGCLFAGPILGLGVARLFAPSSGFASFISFVGMALVFFGGYKLWFLRIALAFWPYLSKEKSLRALYDTLMKRSSSEHRSVLSPEDARAVASRVIKATSSFAIVSVLVGVPVGLVFALASTSFLPAFVLFSAACIIYGYVLTRLARSGYMLTSES